MDSRPPAAKIVDEPIADKGAAGVPGDLVHRHTAGLRPPPVVPSAEAATGTAKIISESTAATLPATTSLTRPSFRETRTRSQCDAGVLACPGLIISLCRVEHRSSGQAEPISLSVDRGLLRDVSPRRPSHLECLLGRKRWPPKTATPSDDMRTNAEVVRSAASGSHSSRHRKTFCVSLPGVGTSS